MHPMMNFLAQMTGDQRHGIVYTVPMEPRFARLRYLRKSIEELEAKSYHSSADIAQLGAWRQELAMMTS